MPLASSESTASPSSPPTAVTVAPPAPRAPAAVIETGGFAGTRRSAFPAVRPPGYFAPDADAAAIAAFFAANGYCVLEDAYTPAEVAALVDDATAICRGRHGDFGGGELPPGLSDAEVLQRYLCIHFPDKISPLMRGTFFNAATLKVLTAVIGPNVKAMQSMLFIKASGKPGQAWHQDEDYIPTRDRSLTGGWIALDRATVENGGLWVIPGSHRHGILWDQHWHGDRRFDCAEESRGFPYADEDSIPVEVEAGSVVFFNGYLLHRSLPNRAPAGTYRRALVNHYMSCESFLPWRKPEETVSMAKADFRDVVVVAGTDPYAHRGYAQVNQPHVRKDGRTGCLDGVTRQPKPYFDDPGHDDE